MDETPLFRGRAYLVMLGTRSVVGTITEITNRLDVDTLAEVPVRELGLNEIGTRDDFAGAARCRASATRSAANWAASS